jgi:hypothetical protein
MFQSQNLVNRRGAIFVSVAQSVLSNGLVDQISTQIRSLDPEVIISAGATGLRSIVSFDLLPVVLDAYNSVMRRIFIISAVLGGCSFLSSLFFEWKSLKGKQVAVVV